MGFGLRILQAVHLDDIQYAFIVRKNDFMVLNDQAPAAWQ